MLEDFPIQGLRVYVPPLGAELSQVQQDLAHLNLAPIENGPLSTVVDDPAENCFLHVPQLLIRGCETEPLAIGWHILRKFLFCFSQIRSH